MTVEASAPLAVGDLVGPPSASSSGTNRRSCSTAWASPPLGARTPGRDSQAGGTRSALCNGTSGPRAS